MIEDGESNYKICSALGISYSYFYNWRKTFKDMKLKKIAKVLKNKHIAIIDEEKPANLPNEIQIIELPQEATPTTSDKNKQMTEEEVFLREAERFSTVILKNPWRKRACKNMSMSKFDSMMTKLMDMSLEGDIRAAQLICQFLITPEKPSSPFKNLKVGNALELNTSMGEVIHGVTTGELTTEDGLAYVSFLKEKRDFHYTEIVEKGLEETKKELQIVKANQLAMNAKKGK